MTNTPTPGVSAMVERVARIVDPAAFNYLRMMQSGDPPHDPAEYMHVAVGNVEGARETAREILKAMREPTGEMAVEGEGVVEWDSDDRSGSWFARYHEGDASTIYRAMIDAALASKAYGEGV